MPGSTCRPSPGWCWPRRSWPVSGASVSRLAPDSRLRALPAALTDTLVVTILGNLLDNAFDAVAKMPAERREVILRVRDGEGTRVAAR